MDNLQAWNIFVSSKKTKRAKRAYTSFYRFKGEKGQVGVDILALDVTVDN